MTKKTNTMPQWPSHEWPTPEGRYGPKPNPNLPPIKKAKKKGLKGQRKGYNV